MMRALLPFCFVLLFLPQAARAQGPPATGEAPHQFLFVIERSSAMKRSETVTLNTVHQLLATGAYGVMRRGDIFGIWTFDGEIHDKKVPPQVWVPEVSGALAGAATQFLKGEKYRWSAKLDPVVARFVQIMKTAPVVTVFLITDGSDVLFGTPFDLEISTILVQHADEMAKEKRPFVVTLAARDGKITGWSVDAGGGRIAVPIAAKPDNQTKPPEPEPAHAKPVDVKPVVKTAVAVTPPSKPPATAPPKPVPVPESPKPAPSEPTKVVEPVKPAAPKVTLQPAKPPPVMAPPANPPPQSSPAPKPAEVVVTTPKPATVQPPPSSPPVVSRPATQPVPQPVSPPAPLPKTVVPAVVVEPGPAPVPTMVSVEIPRPTTGQPQTTATASIRETPPVVAKSAPVAAQERVEPLAKPAIKPPPPPAQTAVVVPGEAAVSGWKFLLLGGALLVVVAIMVMVLLRRSRAVPQASLISRSLDRERK